MADFKEILDVFQTIFLSNLARKSVDGIYTFYMDELLEIYLLIANHKESVPYLKKLLPMLFKLFHDDWSEEVQFLAASCIYSFISTKECKQMIVNDDSLMIKRRAHIPNVTYWYLSSIF